MNFHVLQAFGIKTISYELEVIRRHVNSLEQNTLVLFDNVEQFLVSSREQGSGNDFEKLVETMMKAEKVKLLLTSRQRMDEPSLRRLGFVRV